MDIRMVNLITFSPTHTSKHVGGAIAEGTGLGTQRVVDLTLEEVPATTIEDDALAIVTVPVYGGLVAPLALERLERVHGNGGPAVAVVVYGNRAYEKALEQLSTFLARAGFKVVAAGTFVGEHSYSTDLYPIAAGRPDGDDLLQARDFGARVAEALRQADSLEGLQAVDVSRIRRPSQPLLPMLGFARQVLKMRRHPERYAGSARPEPVPGQCNHCGRCATVCPTGAVSRNEAGEYETQADRCIRCCACVKFCPSHARTFDTPFAALLSTYFKQPKGNQIIL